jgi:hypothetical protein
MVPQDLRLREKPRLCHGCVSLLKVHRKFRNINVKIYRQNITVRLAGF